MLQSDCLPTLVQEELERMITAANLAFHDRLVALAGNAKLPAACRRLVNELALCRRTALALRDTVPVSAREPREIVERIAAGQADGAGRALYEHVMQSRKRMRRAAAAPARRGAATKPF